MKNNNKKNKQAKRLHRLARNSARANARLADDLRHQQQQLNAQSVITHVVPRNSDVPPELPVPQQKVQLVDPRGRPGREKEPRTPGVSKLKPLFAFGSPSSLLPTSAECPPLRAERSPSPQWSPKSEVSPVSSVEYSPKSPKSPAASL